MSVIDVLDLCDVGQLKKGSHAFPLPCLSGETCYMLLYQHNPCPWQGHVCSSLSDAVFDVVVKGCICLRGMPGPIATKKVRPKSGS